MFSIEGGTGSWKTAGVGAVDTMSSGSIGLCCALYLLPLDIVSTHPTPLVIPYPMKNNILEQISNTTVFNFKYFCSDISYQAYFSYVSVWGYEVSFRLRNFKFMSHDQFWWNKLKLGHLILLSCLYAFLKYFALVWRPNVCLIRKT